MIDSTAIAGTEGGADSGMVAGDLQNQTGCTRRSKGSEKSMNRRDIDNHHSLLKLLDGCLHCAAGSSSLFSQSDLFPGYHPVNFVEKVKEGLEQ